MFFVIFLGLPRAPSVPWRWVYFYVMRGQLFSRHSEKEGLFAGMRVGSSRCRFQRKLGFGQEREVQLCSEFT